MDEEKRKLGLYEIRDYLARAPGKLPEEEWCYFCGKTRAEVAEIVVGPIAYICNECVERCVEILAERGVWHS
jgi:hypothetical protein